MAGKSGLQMLLTALGVTITPEQITAMIDQLSNTVMEVDKRLTRIEQKLDALAVPRTYGNSTPIVGNVMGNPAGVVEAAEDPGARFPERMRGGTFDGRRTGS